MSKLLAAAVLAAVPLFAQNVSVSRQAAVDTAAISKAHDALGAKLSGAARQKLDDAASSFWKNADPRTSMMKLSAGAREAITAAFSGAELGAPEIDALAGYVLAEGALATDKDLRALAGELEKIEKQSDALRKQLTVDGKEPNVSVAKSAAAAPETIEAPESLADDATPEEKLKRLEELTSLSKSAAVKTQSLGDKRSKVSDLVSALMKKGVNDELLAKLK